MLRRAATRFALATLRPRAAAPLAGAMHARLAVRTAVAAVDSTRSMHAVPARAHKKKKGGSLVSILKRELEEQKGNCLEAAELQVLQDKVSNDFEIHVTPGVMDVVLEGKANGNTVRVTFDAQDVLDMLEDFEDDDESVKEEEGVNGDYEGEDSGDDVNAHLPGIRVVAEVMRGKQGLQFECTASTSLTIDRVRFVGDYKAVDNGETLYMGPVFDNLESDLQDAFYKYLADHNVDDDLAQFITEFADSKEEQEYLAFLEQTSKFVKQ